MDPPAVTIAGMVTLFLIEFSELWLFPQWLTPLYFPPYIRTCRRLEVILVVVFVFVYIFSF